MIGSDIRASENQKPTETHPISTPKAVPRLGLRFLLWGDDGNAGNDSIIAPKHARALLLTPVVAVVLRQRRPHARSATPSPSDGRRVVERVEGRGGKKWYFTCLSTLHQPYPLFGPLLFGLGPTALAFHPTPTYVHYLRAVNRTQLILLSFIRWQDTPRPAFQHRTGSATSLGVPTRLKDWIRVGATSETRREDSAGSRVLDS